jgi:hypothetical protein
MIGLILRISIIDQSSIAWPGQSKFLKNEAYYLDLFGQQLFDNMKNYIQSFRQFSVGHLISATDFKSDSQGNIIRWRLFSSQEDYDLFNTLSNVEFDNHRIALCDTMNLSITIKEITDPTVIDQILAIPDPTYEDYNSFI